MQGRLIGDHPEDHRAGALGGDLQPVEPGGPLLAQDTLDRGFSVVLNEWHHNPKYTERAQYVPKY